MKDLYAILVEVDFFGNFSETPPLVSQSQGYSVPPPTTLAGALAYPYLREKSMESLGNSSPVRKLIEERKIVYASFWAPLYVQHNDMERIFTMLLQKSQRLKHLQDSSRLVKCLQMIYSDSQYIICRKCMSNKKSSKKTQEECDSINKELCDRFMQECEEVLKEGLEIAYGLGVRTSVYYADHAHLAYLVTEPELAKFSYGIVRIGRKESLVSVRRVSVTRVGDLVREAQRKDEDVMVSTRFYFPCGIAEPFENRDVLDMPVLAPENFSTELTPRSDRFCIPRMFSRANMNVSLYTERSLVLPLGYGDGERFFLPVPREVIEDA